MSNYEVPEPILNSAFEEPRWHWKIEEGREPQKLAGRRPALYFYRDPRARPDQLGGSGPGIQIELALVNLIRERVKAWRASGYPGVTRTTHELLQHWRRDGRERRLFFAQLEAAETIIFLREARADFLQGLEIPREDPGEEKRKAGFLGFVRYAAKMATGAGKTTVMGMLAAWSILNKVNDRGDPRFSDAVLVVCPNVTIRDRLRELNPDEGEASIYRTRDLAPPHLMPRLTQGRVVVTNWHVFEPQSMQTGGVSARVVKAGVQVRTRETIRIGAKNTTARGSRYLTAEELQRQVSAGLLTVLDEKLDADGTLKSVTVEGERYVESDTALVSRVLGKDVGGKQNILVLNDEAHHAYRIRREAGDAGAADDGEDEEEDAAEQLKEATVWIDGLDRVHKLRGINLCLDFSATPYYLGRVGQDTNRPFTWVVSDFGLVDAIESGLVKIPQLAVRDSTAAAIPGYFNIWHWILPQLTPAERGGKRSNPKPEAILKYAHHPIAMLAGLWEEERAARQTASEDPRPPVFIIVCKNTSLSKVIFEWIANDNPPAGIPPAKMAGFRNRDGEVNTIRVDSKVIHETDTEGAKGDEVRWMRLTLDTVGRTSWPVDRQGKPIFPSGFEELAVKLGRPLHPPGRDVRCIVSVGMLTEGWDCNTVTHIVGLRPFLSQLLCEQVVGRGLRRASYEVQDGDRFTEEVAKIFGVPFEVIPFKATQGAPAPPPVKRHHVHAIPAKSEYEIHFPRVEGYTQAIRNRVAMDWTRVAPLVLEPGRIPPEVEMKGLSGHSQGRPALLGPGRLDAVSLKAFRAERRLQELVFDLARSLTRECLAQKRCEAPAHVLFPQLAMIVKRYVEEHVEAEPPADRKDVFLAPYYGWAVENLVQGLGPDVSSGETPEVPRYETNRGPGTTADVDFWTSKDVREVRKCHLNYMVADTLKWEQSAAYVIDRNPAVAAFVKNERLGFAIPYFHNGEHRDYVPDFIIRLQGSPARHLILETKGFDPLADIKRAAAERWAKAVTADGAHGEWSFAMARELKEIRQLLDRQ